MAIGDMGWLEANIHAILRHMPSVALVSKCSADTQCASRAGSLAQFDPVLS